MTVIPTIQLTQEDIGKMGPADTQAARTDVPRLHERLDNIDMLLRAREAFHRDDAYFVLVREEDRYYVLGAVPEYEVSWPPCLVRMRKSDVRPELDIIDVETSGVIHSLNPDGPPQTFVLSCRGASPQPFELQAFSSRTEALSALSEAVPDSFDVVEASKASTASSTNDEEDKGATGDNSSPAGSAASAESSSGGSSNATGDAKKDSQPPLSAPPKSQPPSPPSSRPAPPPASESDSTS